MSRSKFVWRNGTFVDVTNGDPDKPKKEEHHTVINDAMDETVCPVNGKAYSSRSTYEKVVRDHGGVIVGNEKLEGKRVTAPSGVKKDILRAYELCEQRPAEVPPERHEEWVRDVIKERG
jgi:hypothetical protein